MVVKKKKAKVIDGKQFLENDPPIQWPERVQSNLFSVTGYSYGTLQFAMNEHGEMDRDGFEIQDTDWIVTGDDGVVTRMIDLEMQAKYED